MMGKKLRIRSGTLPRETQGNDSTHGFTIAELIVSMVLFAVASISIVSFVAGLQTMQQNAQYHDIASATAKNIIETARSGAFGTFSSASNGAACKTSGFTIADYYPSAAQLPAATANCTIYDLPAPNPLAMKRVQATVSYQTSPSSPVRTVQYSTLAIKEAM